MEKYFGFVLRYTYIIFSPCDSSCAENKVKYSRTKTLLGGKLKNAVYKKTIIDNGSIIIFKYTNRVEMNDAWVKMGIA